MLVSLALRHFLFLKEFSLSCLHLGTDNVSRQISVHIFTPNGGYCLFIDIGDGKGVTSLAQVWGTPWLLLGEGDIPIMLFRDFKTSQRLLDFPQLLDNMLLVTLVKRITFWLLMNFSQSLTFAKSDAYFKTFSNPWLLVGIM